MTDQEAGPSPRSSRGSPSLPLGKQRMEQGLDDRSKPVYICTDCEVSEVQFICDSSLFSVMRGGGGIYHLTVHE